MLGKRLWSLKFGDSWICTCGAVNEKIYQVFTTKRCQLLYTKSLLSTSTVVHSKKRPKVVPPREQV